MNTRSMPAVARQCGLGLSRWRPFVVVPQIGHLAAGQSSCRDAANLDGEECEGEECEGEITRSGSMSQPRGMSADQHRPKGVKVQAKEVRAPVIKGSRKLKVQNSRVKD